MGKFKFYTYILIYSLDDGIKNIYQQLYALHKFRRNLRNTDEHVVSILLSPDFDPRNATIGKHGGEADSCMAAEVGSKQHVGARPGNSLQWANFATLECLENL